MNHKKNLHNNARNSKRDFDLSNLKPVEYKFKGSNATKALKRAFMNSYVDTGGNISYACRQIGLHRRTYYLWVEKDPEFKQMTEELLEEVIDSVEAHLRALIQEKDTRSTIFFLETKGKKRDYVKRTENINTNQNFENLPREIPIKIILPTDEKEKEEMEKRLAHTSPTETKEMSNLSHKKELNNSSHNSKK